MYRIGIDLGGTNIAVGIVDETFSIISQASVPTGAYRPVPEMVADIFIAVEKALANANISISDCLHIGIGTPGNCDSEKGVVNHAYNLGWEKDVPICQLLTDHFGIPAYVSNDANCAALAEVVAGAAVGHQNAVLITLGTGVGGGIIIDGAIYAGMRSAGAELGHTLLVLEGEPCTCGRNGCWEAYASATALIRQATRAAELNPNSSLSKLEKITGKDVFDAADAGDATAQEVVRQYCVYVAAGLTDVINALAPEIILIGGGISRQGERILEPMREYITHHCFGQEEGAIPILCAAKLGNDAGIIGAAALH